MKIAIIREDKNPPDSRVALTPIQVRKLLDQSYDIEVQRSAVRCYSDSEYEALGIPMINEITNHEILIGVKEVPVENIMQGKTYFMFSHTIKEQVYNKNLLRRILDNKCRLIDYEVLTNAKGARVIAFGKFAGMVGAHNAIYTYAQRNSIEFPRMNSLKDYEEAKNFYASVEIPAVKIVLTGAGRVSNGAAKVLKDMGIRKISPLEFLTTEHDKAVFTQITSFHYAKRKDGVTVDNVYDFYNNPDEYESDFHHFLDKTDILINGIYWDPQAPAFFTREQMTKDNFRISVIADVTCDIAPEASIPSTLRATTIADPIFGFDKLAGTECEKHTAGCLDMMTIDNLPNELPRDASEAFGDMFIEHVLEELAKDESEIIERATIASEGQLGTHFQYLKDYAQA